MHELIAANIAPLMFGSLVIFLLVGYPVAFLAGRLRTCSIRWSASSSAFCRHR